MIISIPKSKAAEFERRVNCPMVQIESVLVRKASIEYEIDIPEFFELPYWAQEL